LVSIITSTLTEDTILIREPLGRALFLMAASLAGCGSKPTVVPPAASSETTAESSWKVPREPRKDGSSFTTVTGLRYEVLKEGIGDVVKTGERVTVNYTGTLEDGKTFDDSGKRGQPLLFQLGADQVVLGFNEGVTGMKVGEKRRLVLPPNIGYGALGSLPDVPPNATLTFEIELVKIERAASR
jgi:FKBP-type peptidyl-prolyl cis-trans isomerase